MEKKFLQNIRLQFRKVEKKMQFTVLFSSLLKIISVVAKCLKMRAKATNYDEEFIMAPDEVFDLRDQKEDSARFY